MNLFEKMKESMKKPSFRPIIFGGIIAFGVGVVSIAFLYDDESVPNGTVLENPNSIGGDTSKPSSNVQKAEEEGASKVEELKESDEKVQLDEDNKLQNPIADETFSMTEDEWLYTKSLVDGMVRDYKFVEANELLNNRVIGLPLDSLEFGADIQTTHMDINGLSFVESTYSNNLSDIEVGDALNPLIYQNTPERALIAALWISMNAKVEVILSQESLAPVTEEAPLIEGERPLEDEHILRVLRNTYPKAEPIILDFTLEGFPLEAILLKQPDETYRVWQINQEADGTAPYQSVKFWREYLKSISPAGAIQNQGSGHGNNYSDDYIIDTPDPRKGAAD